jgi:hypothetical protein
MTGIGKIKTVRQDTAVDLALSVAAKHDGFVDDLMRNFRQIDPAVGESVAFVFIEACRRAMPARAGTQRLALNLAACASGAAIMLTEAGDAAGDREKAVVTAFAALLKEALKNAKDDRLKRVMGHA